MHRILIVEDDRDIAQLMETALTQAGYQVELAFDGEVGADLIEQNWYALALLDIMLPKIDGALRAVASGVESVVIKQAEALLDAGGTMIRG